MAGDIAAEMIASAEPQTLQLEGGKRRIALWLTGGVIIVIGAVEFTFVYGSPALSALLALLLALGCAAICAIALPQPALVRSLESLALVPTYILLSASLPWFFLDPQLLLPAVYSLVLALCLWQAEARDGGIRHIWGSLGSWRSMLGMAGLALPLGVPLGTVEYLLLQPPAPSPAFQLTFLARDLFFMLCFVAVGEELLFRGLIQRDLSKALGWRTGLLLSSVLFAVMHLSWRSASELLFVFVAGGLMGYLYHRTGSLMAPVLLHAANNVFLVSVAPYLIPHVLHR